MSLPVGDRPRRPEWMKVRAPSADSRYDEVRRLVHGQHLHTICEEAHCPNVGECWGRGSAAFQILGDVAMRNRQVTEAGLLFEKAYGIARNLKEPGPRIASIMRWVTGQTAVPKIMSA